MMYECRWLLRCVCVGVKIECWAEEQGGQVSGDYNISLRKGLRLLLLLLALLLLLPLLSSWGAGAAEARKAKANERVSETVIKRIVYEKCYGCGLNEMGSVFDGRE